MRGFHEELVEYRTHFRWSAIVVLLAFFVLACRFFQIQVVDGGRYEALATVSHVVRERIPAPRGVIRDRAGEVLARDVKVSDLMVVPQYVRDLDGETARLVELGVIDQDDASQLKEMVLATKGTRKRFHKLLAHRNLVGAWCPHDLATMTFDAAHGVMVCPDCGRSYANQEAVVETHLHELPGFSLRSRTVRHYPAKSLVAHVVGFVNEATADEVDRSGGRLRPGDTVGRTGIERALDATLRGVPGEDVYVRMASGRRVSPKDLPPPFDDLSGTTPVAGRDVVLTIDAAMQKAAAEALAAVPSGAVVAMDVRTGEVLAMFSQPSFDPGPAFTGDAGGDTKPVDPIYAPRMNKAVTAYPPGSTFKMVTAMAALNEGLVSADTEVFCPGFYEFRGHRFNCFKRYGHGRIDLVHAISESCDTYFYQLGDLLGLDNLAHYARDVFGLGDRTGIEIAEDAGLVPTERWYRRHRFGVQPGFALNTAVGQGDMRVSPLAMARAYAALVNGGLLMRPHLVASVADKVTGKQVPVEPEVQRELDFPEEYVETVMEGLYGAVNSDKGTAHGAAIPELPFAGKTGTAQAREVRRGASSAVAAWLLQDHAWFVAYAPASRPRVVVVALVEHGGFGGAVAAPIVRRIIETYYAEHAEEFADLWQGSESDEPLEVVHGP